MDLSETLIRDIRQQVGDDAAVQDFVAATAVDPKSVDEVMRMFNNIPRVEVERILKKHNSNVDSSLNEFFQLHTEIISKTQEEARKRQLEETEKLLQRTFAGLDRKVIQQVLAKHSGDIERASNELLNIMKEEQDRLEHKLKGEREKELQEKQERERIGRAKLVEHFVVTFDQLARKEVVEVLQSVNYDVEKSVGILRNKANERKLANLCHALPRVPEAHVKAALEKCNWDIQKAFAFLNGSIAAPVVSVVPPELELEQNVVAAEVASGNNVLGQPEAKNLMLSILRQHTAPVQEEVEKKAEPQNAELEALANQQPVGALLLALEVSSNNLSYGQSLTVAISAKNGEPSSGDWVGLFEASATTNDSPVTWKWFQPSLTFTPPSYGVFELRYLRKIDGQKKQLAVSGKVVVGPSVKLNVQQTEHDWIVSLAWNEASEKINSSAWVGLYRTGASNSEYLAFNYVKENPSAPISFLRQRLNGTYEFRFFGYKFQQLAVSDVIDIRDEDRVELYREDENVRVIATLASVDPTKDGYCWVAVCFKNDTRPGNYRRYEYISRPKQVSVFKTPIHNGEYEARIYNSKSELLATSKQTVQIVGIN